MREELLARSHAYKQTFDGTNAKKILEDLERFCHANSTTHVEGDSHGTAQLEGRRQVWLRIQGYLNLRDSQVGEYVSQAETEETE